MPDDHGSNHLPALTSDMSPTPCSHKGLTSRNLALGTSRNFVSFIKYFFNYERKSPEPCGFGLLLGHPLFRSVGTGCDGSGTWIRTKINRFRVCCPAIRRSRSVVSEVLSFAQYFRTKRRDTVPAVIPERSEPDERFTLICERSDGTRRNRDPGIKRVIKRVAPDWCKQRRARARV